MKNKKNFDIIRARDFIIESNGLVDYKYADYNHAINETHHVKKNTTILRWDFDFLLIKLSPENPEMNDTLEILNIQHIEYIEKTLKVLETLNKLKGESNNDPITFIYHKNKLSEFTLKLNSKNFYSLINENEFCYDTDPIFDGKYIHDTVKKDLMIETAIFLGKELEEVTDDDLNVIQMFVF